MSKKKGKPVAGRAPNKTAAKKTAPKKKATKQASTSRAAGRLTTAAEDAGRTLTVTIFIYQTNNGNRIRTSPQRLYANPGDRVAWNIVNLVDGSDVPVTITWPEGGPWGKEPIAFKNWTKVSFEGAAASGRFKYVVSALDAQEDPEIELPEGN